jgi:predicted nucleotide-binding protein (sugar kinase/HSP70/actin superfamily)
MNPESKFGVPLDQPTFTFNDIGLLKKACFVYLNQFGVNKRVFEKAFQAAIEEQARFKRALQVKADQLLDKNIKQDRFLLLLAGRPYHVDPLINHNIPKYITDFGVDVITEDSISDRSFNDLSGAHVLTQWAFTNRLYEVAHWAGTNNHVEFIQLNSFGCGPDALSMDEIKSILNVYGKNQTLIRIDENSSPGSVKLRIRSLIESLRLRKNLKKKSSIPRVTTRPFSASKDKRKVMISPDFGPFYSDIMPHIFNSVGIQLNILPPADKKSVEIGLQHINNEICYPAIIVAGNILKELMSGRFDPDEVFVGLTQTGGQCRASSYTSLIKKGLVSAGFRHVPVVSVPTGHYKISDTSEFTVDTDSLLTNGFLYFLYADSIIQMHNATVFREKFPGTTASITNKFLSNEMLSFDKPGLSIMLSILKNAVTEFNTIPIKDGIFPKIGLVGEIYVKYNSLANHYLVDWLRNQEIDVVIPPIIDFFLHPFVDHKANVKAHLKRTVQSRLKALLLEKRTRYAMIQFNQTMKKFRFYRPFHDIKKIAQKGSLIVNLVQQFGEGWLLPAEIVFFAVEGLHDVLCLQPFGCLANHVIARGTEKRLRDLYPQLNLLFLDMDADTSEANMHNRLHFLIQGAKESISP